jgi:hypothetical protein
MSVRAAVSGVRPALRGQLVVGTVTARRVLGYRETGFREQYVFVIYVYLINKMMLIRH